MGSTLANSSIDLRYELHSHHQIEPPSSFIPRIYNFHRSSETSHTTLSDSYDAKPEIPPRNLDTEDAKKKTATLAPCSPLSLSNCSSNSNDSLPLSGNINLYGDNVKTNSLMFVYADTNNEEILSFGDDVESSSLYGNVMAYSHDSSDVDISPEPDSFVLKNVCYGQDNKEDNTEECLEN